jgi:transposase
MKLSADATWPAMAAVDMRTGIDGLSLHVQQALRTRRGSASTS